MSTTLSPAGHEPEGESEPEQSGAGRPNHHDRLESAGRSFRRGMAEGAGQVVGTAIASAVIIGLVAGGVIAEKQNGPHQSGGAASNCTA